MSNRSSNPSKPLNSDHSDIKAKLKPMLSECYDTENNDQLLNNVIAALIPLAREQSYPVTISDKGSVTAASHVSDTAITNVVMQIMENEGINLSAEDYDKMNDPQLKDYLRTTLKRKKHTLIFRNGNLNGSFARRHPQSDEKAFPRQHVSITSTNNQGEEQSIPLPDTSYVILPEELETADLLELNEQLEINIFNAALNQPELLFHFPKVTDLAVIKHLMFKSGMALIGQQHISSDYLTLLHKWWRHCNVSQLVLQRWLLQLPNLQDRLNEATGHHQKLVKDAMLDAFSLTNSLRESLRRSLNHASKGVHLALLTIWITMSAPRDEYREMFLNLTSHMVKPATQVYSAERENFSSVDMYRYIEGIVECNRLLLKSELRPLLSMIIYDQPLNKLSTRKLDSIKRLTHFAFQLSEEVSQSIESNAPVAWR